MQRDSLQGAGEGKPWNGFIRFQCPWAHPLWSDYVLTVCDLTTDTGSPPIKYMSDATHEVLVWACDPHYPIDFTHTPAAGEPLGTKFLRPANHGYQFKAESNEAAWARVNALVDAIEARTLSPDTDFTQLWDVHFKDGATLKKNAFTNAVKVHLGDTQ